MINKFDKANLAQLRIEIQSSLDQIAQTHGLESIKLGAIRFDVGSFKSTLEAKTKLENNPEAQKKNDDDNLMYSQALGYNKNIVGLTFKSQLKIFTITKIDFGKRKYPIIATSKMDGKSFKFQNTKRLQFVPEDESITWSDPFGG